MSAPEAPAPFGRRLARVAANRAVGAFRLLEVEDGPGPARPRAGQFYMLAAQDRWGGGEPTGRPYLPRACSFARVRPGENGMTLSFLLEASGPGTQRLGALAAGDGVWLLGPLGRGFAERTRLSPVLVGGGVGVAPLLALADEEVQGADPAPVALLGFRSAAHAEVAALFPGTPEIATDDGSRGRAGTVVSLLEDVLRADAEAEVFACGPAGMLEAVRVTCSGRGPRTQLALESGMACGFGACYGCVHPTRSGYVRLCLDGPVLDADQLDHVLVPGKPAVAALVTGAQA